MISMFECMISKFISMKSVIHDKTLEIKSEVYA